MTAPLSNFDPVSDGLRYRTQSSAAPTARKALPRSTSAQSDHSVITDDGNQVDEIAHGMLLCSMSGQSTAVTSRNASRPVFLLAEPLGFDPHAVQAGDPYTRVGG